MAAKPLWYPELARVFPFLDADVRNKSRIDALTINNRGERAGRDPASLVFKEVDVQGWALAMRGQRETNLQPDLTVFRNSPKLHAFFGVPILQHKRLGG